MAFVAEAVEIITDDGSGIPVTYDNTAIGLATDGHFYLITDRFGLNGTHPITGDTDRDIWYEGILSRDFDAFSISGSVDFVESGNIASVSSFAFSIVNTSAFWNTLQTNNVHLGRCKVKYYRVTSEDGEEFNFEQRWEGVIDDQPFTELTYSIRCVDNSKDIFTSLPIRYADSATFPKANKDSFDKSIPIAIGRVAYSPMVNISSVGEKTYLVQIFGIEYTTCSATALSGTNLSLYTKGKLFRVDDETLKNRFISVVSGGTAQTRRILSNAATATTTEFTVVTLEEEFEDDGDFVGWSLGNNTSDVWYFEVSKFSADLIASSRPIYEYVDGEYGLPAIYTFESDTKSFTDISESKFLSSTTNIASSGYPGLRVLAKSVDTQGNFSVYFPVYATEVKQSFLDDDFTWDGPALNVTAPSLFDINKSTYYTLEGAGTFTFDVTLPSVEKLKTLDNLFILFDFSHRFVTGPSGVGVAVSAKGLDLYGREINNVVANYHVFNASLGTNFSTQEVHTLPGTYYNEEDSPNGFYTHKGSLSISSLIDNIKKSLMFPVVRISFTVAHLDTDYQMRFQEIGFAAQKNINLSSETVYSTLRGEIFGTSWNARKTAVNPIYLIGDALEHLIRNYDYPYPKWQASYPYVVGEIIRPSTLDNDHYYRCTVAGTTSSSPPTFPTTSGDTVTDGSVTWMEIGSIKINTPSFDALWSQRNSWFIGRTLTERRNSVDYYKQLAAHGFFLILQDAQGNVKVKAWRENTDPDVTFSSTNILQGSLGELRLTPVRRVYNDLLVKYDYNPATNSFNKQIFVTNIEQPSFPPESQSISSGTNLGSFTVSGWFTPPYVFNFTTSSPHGLQTGDYVSLSGNTHGYDFSPKVVTVVTSTEFAVLDGHLISAPSSTTGTLYANDVFLPKWKTYVGGINDYAAAKALWDKCHASYLITKVIQKLPSELSDCHWFIDPAAKDPGGNLIWTDLDVGDNHPAYFYAVNLAEWTAWQKKQITFEAADNATTSALEKGDPVFFNDAKLTNGSSLLGWIHEKVQLGRTDKLPERFRFGITLNPEQLEICDTITESGSQPDTITESGSQPDTITEGEC